MKRAVEEYLESAEAKIEQKKWQEAKLDLQNAIAIDPAHWDIHFNLGIILLKQQQYDQAIAAFNQSILIKPDFDWSYYNLGKAFLKLGRASDAVQSLIKAVSINQDNPLFHYDLGIAFLQKGSLEQSKQAIACFSKAIELNPKDHELCFQLGESFKNQDLNPEAINCFCRTIELNPHYNPAYISLRYIKLELTQKEYLAHFYQKILAQDPHLPEALANLAEIVACQGNSAEAIALSRQAVQAKTIQSNPQLADADWQIKKKSSRLYHHWRRKIWDNFFVQVFR